MSIIAWCILSHPKHRMLFSELHRVHCSSRLPRDFIVLASKCILRALLFSSQLFNLIAKELLLYLLLLLKQLPLRDHQH